MLYRWFDDPERAREPYSPKDHPTISASYVADLRASSGRYPNDRRIHDFIAILTRRSTEFATLWSTADVGVRRSGQHAIRHRTLGAIELECAALLNETGRQRLVWYTPRIGGTAVTQLQMLSAVGDQFSATARHDAPQPTWQVRS